MKSQYPIVPTKPTLEDMANFLRAIARFRETEDLPDFTNLNTVFVTGRSVTKIPTSATDVAVTDNIGDVSYALNGTFMYILVNVSGNLRWARVALDTGW